MAKAVEMPIVRTIVSALVFAWLAGCDTPHTNVVIDNRYGSPFVVYRASWQVLSFPNAVAPGASSDPQTSIPASPTTAYVLLAPGWDPDAGAKPTFLIVMQSRGGYGLNLDETLHIPVDNTTFAGNCVLGSFLSQAEADFITQRVFPNDFAALSYDAATCTTLPIGDASAD